MAGVYQEQSDLVLIKPISFSQLRDLAERIRSTIRYGVFQVIGSAD
jgi:hypothetical protein